MALTAKYSLNSGAQEKAFKKRRALARIALILFKDGQEANRIVGFRPKAELAKLLEG